jgi:hypothetical protein
MRLPPPAHLWQRAMENSVSLNMDYFAVEINRRVRQDDGSGTHERTLLLCRWGGRVGRVRWIRLARSLRRKTVHCDKKTYRNSAITERFSTETRTLTQLKLLIDFN